MVVATSDRHRAYLNCPMGVFNMAAHNKFIALLIALVVSVSGCATSGNASLTNQASIDAIQINKTTKDDIAKMFGAPSGKGL